MEERVVWLDGEFVVESQAKVSIFDSGYLHGDTAFDLARTYRHKPFRLQDHLERLYCTCRYLRLDPKMPISEMEKLALEVLDRNRHLLGSDDDFILGQNVSRGTLGLLPELSDSGRPNISIYCQPIPFRNYAKYYIVGYSLITPSTRRTPSQCLEARGKMRNYLNLIVAEQEVKAANPVCTSLLLDMDGYLTENISGNFFMVRNGKLLTPSTRNILAGITRQVTIDLAEKLGIEVSEGDFRIYDAYNSDEAFLTMTSRGQIPVSKINGVSIGTGVPGPVTSALQKALSEEVGVDIVEQFMSHLTNDERAALSNNDVME